MFFSLFCPQVHAGGSLLCRFLTFSSFVSILSVKGLADTLLGEWARGPGLFQDFHQHQRRLKGQKIRRTAADMSRLVHWFLQRCSVFLVAAAFISLPSNWAACSAHGLFHWIHIEHGRGLAFHPPDSFCWSPSCGWGWQTFVSGVRSCSPAGFLRFRYSRFFLSFRSKWNYVAFVHNSN